jgi:formate--tetrahydrofolate ligase
MAALLKDALKPNLVQTLEHTPAFVHGGPFANIAHGCNSIIATAMALKLADYVVTEAGFGADLGAEKFLDIKCRASGLKPSAVVIVATARALKMHGGVQKSELNTENLEAIEQGLPNLLKHVENIKDKFGLPAVVAVNRFPSDTEAELKLIAEKCKAHGIDAALTEGWAKGGEGGIALAKEVIRLADSPSGLRHPYASELPIREKIQKIVCEIYGGEGADFSPAAEREIDQLEDQGFGTLPICMAKTQYSFSDDAKKTGRPEGFRVSVKNVKVSAGAGFIVALTGDIMTMPGLPKFPSAEKIDVDSNGRITGLF